MRLSMGLILNIIIRLSLLYFLGEVFFFPDDPRFSGKAIPIRNLIIVGTLSLFFPLLYFVKKRWNGSTRSTSSGLTTRQYPVWLDNLYLSIFWLDMAGNSLDLYDTYFYFDLLPHMHGTGTIAAVFYAAFGLPALGAIGLANVIHILLEAQEIFTDIFFGTHNVRGAFDTINDIIAGILGTVLYVGIFCLWRKHWHRRILQFVIVFFTTVILLALFFHQAIATHIKVVLLISQQFQLPIKLLHVSTNEPSQKRIELDLENGKGKIVADLISPVQNRGTVDKHKKPVIILAMGVKTSEKDKPIIMDFAKQLARIGYIVLWPRLETLDKGISGFEQPETFMRAFEYLERLDTADPSTSLRVNKERISFVGFSVGSSIAFTSATDPEIRDKLHGLVFFGGYYDIFAYLTSIATKSVQLDGREIAWEPDESAMSHLREIGEETKADVLLALGKTQSSEEVERIFGSADANEIESLQSISPKEHISDFKVRIFILHEKSDTFVPYVESVKLAQALPGDIRQTFVLVNLFEHVQPKKGFSPELLGEFIKLYGFLYETLRFL